MMSLEAEFYKATAEITELRARLDTLTTAARKLADVATDSVEYDSWVDLREAVERVVDLLPADEDE